MKCHYCNEPGNLRPYGPKGAMICFACMKASPGREAEAKRRFGLQLAACGDVAVIDGSQAGPYPYAKEPS